MLAQAGEDSFQQPFPGLTQAQLPAPILPDRRRHPGKIARQNVQPLFAVGGEVAAGDGVGRRWRRGFRFLRWRPAIPPQGCQRRGVPAAADHHDRAVILLHGPCHPAGHPGFPLPAVFSAAAIAAQLDKVRFQRLLQTGALGFIFEQMVPKRVGILYSAGGKQALLVIGAASVRGIAVILSLRPDR